MSIVWTPKWPDGRPNSPNRGGAPVGHLAELPPLERSAVLYLRKWCSGPEGREAVAQDFSQVFQPARAAHEVNTFAALITYLSEGCRRPIMRHDFGCTCFGGDESAFANMVAASVAGDREDAMVFALSLMRPDMAWQAVTAAEEFGLALLAINRAFMILSSRSTAHLTTLTRH